MVLVLVFCQRLLLPFSWAHPAKRRYYWCRCCIFASVRFARVPTAPRFSGTFWPAPCRKCSGIHATHRRRYRCDEERWNIAKFPWTPPAGSRVSPLCAPRFLASRSQQSTARSAEYSSVWQWFHPGTSSFAGCEPVYHWKIYLSPGSAPGSADFALSAENSAAWGAWILWACTRFGRGTCIPSSASSARKFRTRFQSARTAVRAIWSLWFWTWAGSLCTPPLACHNFPRAQAGLFANIADRSTGRPGTYGRKPDHARPGSISESILDSRSAGSGTGPQPIGTVLPRALAAAFAGFYWSTSGKRTICSHKYQYGQGDSWAGQTDRTLPLRTSPSDTGRSLCVWRTAHRI